ncbi:MAG: hypothetical protein OES84_00165 [Kiritimatiellaceae bacterium]|nr:hypothetical protein [Kiritimatiellaceae bacterium]
MADHMAKGRYPEHHAENGHNAKLTWEDVRAIRKRVTNGEKYIDISFDYGVTPESISNIARELTWEKKYEPE